jgi:hypothetical protein
MDPERTTEPPDSRLGRLCGDLLTMFDAMDGEGVQLIAMLSASASATERGHIIGLSGYDDDNDAIADLFGHLTALFEANGKKLLIMPIGMG